MMLRTGSPSEPTPEDGAFLNGDLTRWAEDVLAPQGHGPAAHHRLLLNELAGVARGDCDRLMVLMPPGAAKSTYASVLFPAWWMAQRPRGAVIATSHTASLARHFGGQVRTLLREHGARAGCGLVKGEAGAGQFRTETNGSYYAVGVRGPVTGRRADLVLIDDPIKSHAEADNPAARDRIWAWYRADLATRLKPKGAIILVMTRWHPDDLAGRLLASDDEWRVVCLPALAEANDPVGRPPGEALWGDWEDADALARKRRMVGERAWSAQFQQRPTIGLGGVFFPTRILVVEQAPELDATVRAWDLAATAGTKGDPDWTVGLKLGRAVNGQFVVLDVVRLRGDPAEVEAAICRTARADGIGVRISLPQDPGQAGRYQVQYFTRQLAGFVVSSSRENGAKDTRAMPVASQVDGGNLAIVRAAWNGTLLDELGDFPFGTKDDQVDALSRAFGELIDTPAPTRRLSLPFLAR